MRFAYSLGTVFVVCLSVLPVSAQQVTVATPFHSVSDSFFEHTGTNWGFNWGGVTGSFGRPNMAAPGFGGFDPNAGISTGLRMQRGNFNGFLNMSAGQGFRQSFVSETPSVTLTNGYPGVIRDTSQRPFVIGNIPVVGGAPMVGGFPMVPMPQPTYSPGYTTGRPRNHRVQAMLDQMAQRLADETNPAVATPRTPPRPAAPVRPQPDRNNGLNLVGPAGGSSGHGGSAASGLASAQSSSAARAVPSVAEARRAFQREQAAKEREAKTLFEKGLAAEQGGKPQVAKVLYRMAARKATGQTKKQAEARLATLTSPGEQ